MKRGREENRWKMKHILHKHGQAWIRNGRFACNTVCFEDNAWHIRIKIHPQRTVEKIVVRRWENRSIHSDTSWNFLYVWVDADQNINPRFLWNTLKFFRRCDSLSWRRITTWCNWRWLCDSGSIYIFQWSRNCIRGTWNLCYSNWKYTRPVWNGQW